MKQKKAITWILVAALVILAAWQIWLRFPNETYVVQQDSRLLMDTVITITVVAKEGVAQETLDRGFEELRRVDTLTNRYIGDSELSKLNKERTLAVSKDLLHLIEISEEYRHKSGNAYDTRLGRLVDLWGFGSNRRSVPSEVQIAKVLPSGDIEINNSTVTLPADVILDLGAVAKGYAIEQARNVMKRTAKAGLIVGGGSSVACWGEHPEKRPWRIGLRHPRDTNKLLGVIELEDGWSLGTSGDYERYFIQDSKRYHHILDGRTGYPGQDVYATSVLTKSSTLADILSTLLFVLGPEDGKAFLNENGFDEIGVIWVMAPGEIVTYEKGVKLPELSF